MIPASTIARMASLGLTAEQASAVAEMIAEVEAATEAKVAALTATPVKARSAGAERQARYRARRGLTEVAWEALRQRVTKRDGFVCSSCEAADADRCVHATPPARGALSSEGKPVAACSSCERSRPGSEFRE